MSDSSRMKTCLLAVLLCLTLLGRTCFAVKRNANLEFWQSTSVSTDLDKDWAVYGAQETRHGRHNGSPYQYNVDMGIVYRGLADWLDLGMSFKKEYEQDSSGKFRHENRPHLNITLKGKLLNCDTSNRIRIEYRDREHKKHEYRLRNKTTFRLPCKFTALELQPYIAEEWFLNLGDSNINQNRVYTGFTWTVAKHMKASIFYVWKASRGTGGWANTNVIGTDLKFPF